MKELLTVMLGSAVGGGLRYLVSRWTAALFATAFPLGTLTVNVLGCLIIGFVSGLPMDGSLDARTRLLLTTGFCGGFTTFSTFANESLSLLGDHSLMAWGYMAVSLLLGLAAVAAGHCLAKAVAPTV